MVSVCLPSDALLQHLPSSLGFSYLEHGVSLHGCSSKVQPLLLTLGEGYLLTTAPLDLECGVAPVGPPVPTPRLFLGREVAPPTEKRSCFCILPSRFLLFLTRFHSSPLVLPVMKVPSDRNSFSFMTPSLSQCTSSHLEVLSLFHFYVSILCPTWFQGA